MKVMTHKCACCRAMKSDIHDGTAAYASRIQFGEIRPKKMKCRTSDAFQDFEDFKVLLGDSSNLLGSGASSHDNRAL